MTLKSIYSELKRAQASAYAVPLFDVSDTTSAEGIFKALEDRCAPAMVAVYAPLIENTQGRAFVAYLRARAEDSPIPISIMLDHGGSFEVCIKALRCGFTDVMYDGSRLPLDENIAQARLVARAAHAAGAKVEAELGHVGSGSSYQSFGAKRAGFTDPQEVAYFIEETGVDFLAVAIGTAHGQYQGEPMLDLDLLREIRGKVEIPLSLHGGSGLTADQFQQAITAGISKINIATDLYHSAGQKMIQKAAEDNTSYFQLTQAGIEAFQERSAYYLDIFGASGKANPARS
jgi:fructose-bisphosphate aldolase, class II